MIAFREKRSDKYPKIGIEIAAAIENTEITRLTLNWETSSTVFIFGRIGISIEFPRTRIIGIELIAKTVKPFGFCFDNKCTPLLEK